MTTRSELIESICSVVLSEDYSSDQKTSAKKLLESLSQGRITEEEAQDKYSSIISSGTKYWMDKYKSKAVYDSLKKYQSGKLDLIGTSKMISSLITHAFIELESQKVTGVTREELGIPELISVLGELIQVEELSEIQDRINSVLLKYGYIRKDEGGDQ